MANRIRMNGVTYESVEHMPPLVRKLYEQARAQLPDSPEPGESLNVIEGGGGPVRHRTVVRTNLVLHRGSLEGDIATPRIDKQNPKNTKNAFEFTVRLGGDEPDAPPSSPPDTNRSANAERQFRTMLALAAFAIVVLALWFVTRTP